MSHGEEDNVDTTITYRFHSSVGLNVASSQIDDHPGLSTLQNYISPSKLTICIYTRYIKNNVFIIFFSVTNAPTVE